MAHTRRGLRFLSSQLEPAGGVQPGIVNQSLEQAVAKVRQAMIFSMADTMVEVINNGLQVTEATGYPWLD
ncbi:hypothetical protein [Arthrobacter sp. lap29]|uniref:hypothetical protein n=1 Tax=Arthrobacter sp. lap29 TaxID=3056122 RepID=UPI0028F6EDD6|nr:hypothetical protein [Arthrobacter sp. lap29]